MSRVVPVSRHELEKRRQEVLDHLDMTFEDLAHRAERGVLSGEEWDAWQKLADIDFLLGRDR